VLGLQVLNKSKIKSPEYIFSFLFIWSWFELSISPWNVTYLSATLKPSPWNIHSTLCSTTCDRTKGILNKIVTNTLGNIISNVVYLNKIFTNIHHVGPLQQKQQTDKLFTFYRYEISKFIYCISCEYAVGFHYVTPSDDNAKLLIFLKSSIFLNITPWSPLNINWRFGGIFRLHLHGRRINQGRIQL
jgi:hypothetical protein